MTLIGLTGQKRAGKDTVAEVLVNDYGFVRLAFADHLKAMAYQRNPELVFDNGLGGFEYANLAQLVDDHGWEKAKEFQPVRQFLQDFGVFYREAYDTDYWLNHVMRTVDHGKDGYEVYTVGGKAPIAVSPGVDYVITDCRFPNEIEAIRDRGGYFVVVERPGLPDTDQHISETAWRQYVPDVTLRNEGTLEDLNRAVADMMATLEPSPRPA